MFAWLKKPQPTLLDQMLTTVYGTPLPKKTANLETAFQLAYAQLLGGIVSEDEVREVTRALNNSPIPYSTHDLALAVALNFFRRPDQVERLSSVQLQARRIAAAWAQDPQTKIPALFFQSFEDSLRKQYPSVKKQTQPKELPELLQQLFGDGDTEFWADSYREWAFDRGIALSERTTDELIARVHNIVLENFRPIPEKGIKEEDLSLHTIGYIVLSMLVVNERAGADFMMEHLQYQIDFFRSNGLRPEYAHGFPFPNSPKWKPDSGSV